MNGFKMFSHWGSGLDPPSQSDESLGKSETRRYLEEVVLLFKPVGPMYMVETINHGNITTRMDV